MPVEKACSVCGQAFGCGQGTAAGGPGCWCESLPTLKPSAGLDCLCSGCLAAKIADQAHANPREQAAER